MIKGMTLGGQRSKIPLVLGLGLGVVAAILIAVYLSGAKSESGGSVSGPSVPVVVAAQNLAAGTRITADMVAVKSVPQGSLLTGAFDKTDAVVNQVTTVPVVAGEQIIASKVTATGAAIKDYGEHPPLSLLLPEGMRAVSVEVSSLIAAGGNIRPGDRVDVILSVKTDAQNGGTQGSTQVAATVLQNLEVLAVDQDVAKASAGTPGGTASTDANNAKATTVTLAATPVQSEVLAVADTCRANFDGRLALALRGFGDQAKTGRAEWSEGRPPDCASLLGIAALP